LSDNSKIQPNTLNRNWRAWLWEILLVLSLVFWLIFALGVDPIRAWRGFLVNFLFFVSLAAGMVVWPAIVLQAHGRWTNYILERSALSAIGFAPVSLVTFVLLWIGYPFWAQWLQFEPLNQGVWLKPIWVFLRDFIGLAVLWLFVWWFVRSRQKGRSGKSAGWAIVIYCAVFSQLGFDLVMALDPKWYSALFGGYFFISGAYIGVAGWAFSATFHDIDRDQLSDLGKLLITFSLLTTYMMFSQLLPIWYENLPHEIRFLVPRMNIVIGRWISWGLLAVVYLGPLVILLTRWSKQTRSFLGAVALLMLIGMWIERWWLVYPTAQERPWSLGLPELTSTVLFLSAFILSRRYACGRLVNHDHKDTDT
jgi:hypothetical protein